MKVKTSPYCAQCQSSLELLGAYLCTDLRLAIEVELVGVNSIGHCAPDERDVVEDQGWLVGVPEEDLLEHRTEYDDGEGSCRQRETDQGLRREETCDQSVRGHGCHSGLGRRMLLVNFRTGCSGSLTCSLCASAASLLVVTDVPGGTASVTSELHVRRIREMSTSEVRKDGGRVTAST